VSRLRRLGNLCITDPVLTDWANFCRASGAEQPAERPLNEQLNDEKISWQI
jgi:hypothetical protein